jgi:hypothetical protein
MGQIRQHTGVPEKGTDRQIGADRHHVEHQRRLKIGPQGSLGRYRQHVVDQPDPTEVDEWETAGGTDRKYRHGLGRPGDGVAPSGPKQVQNGGNQVPEWAIPTQNTKLIR